MADDRPSVDIYRSEYVDLMGADKGGSVKFMKHGGTHHTLVGGVDSEGQGVRVSWDEDRFGNHRPGSEHPGSYPLRRDES